MSVFGVIRTGALEFDTNAREAQVVGEVSLGKRVAEREERVHDKVRRTNVEVEEIKPKEIKIDVA